MRVKCEACDRETGRPYVDDEGRELCPRCYGGPTFAGAHDEDEPALPPALMGCVRF